MDGRVIILDVCLKELKKLPLGLQKDLLTIIEQLSDGVKFSLPLSRPMPSRKRPRPLPKRTWIWQRKD